MKRGGVFLGTTLHRSVKSVPTLVPDVHLRMLMNGAYDVACTVKKQVMVKSVLK